MAIAQPGVGVVTVTGQAVGKQRLYNESLTGAISLSGVDTSITRLYASATDTLNSAITLVDSQLILESASDEFTLAVALSDVYRLIVAVSSTVSIAETVSPAAIMHQSVADGVAFTFALPDSTDRYEGWVVNANTLAPSRYEGYGFNSFAKIGNKFLGAKFNGVFELTGDDDNGEDIDASVLLRKDDFGTQQLKAMYNAVLGVATDGAMYLRVVHENAPSYNYKIQITSEEMRNARVDIGRRLALRYWQIEVYNANGADFEIESMKLYPVVLTRRVTER